MITYGEGGEERRPGKTLLFDVTCGFAHRVSLTKLFMLDGDMHPYLAALMVAILAQAGEALVMLESKQNTTMTGEAFNNILLKEVSHNYDNYRLVSR